MEFDGFGFLIRVFIVCMYKSCFIIFMFICYLIN